MAYEISRREFLKGTAVSGTAIASVPLIRRLEAALGYGSAVHAQPKTNISREFLHKLDKFKEHFYCQGECLDLRVEGESKFKDEKESKGVAVYYDAEYKKEVRDGTTYLTKPIGLKKGAPLVLKISGEKYPHSNRYVFFPGSAEYLRDTNLDGIVDEYTGIGDRPTLDVKKLPADIRVSIQQKYEAGLSGLMAEIDRIVREYAGVSRPTQKAVPKK